MILQTHLRALIYTLFIILVIVEASTVPVVASGAAARGGGKASSCEGRGVASGVLGLEFIGFRVQGIILLLKNSPVAGHGTRK